MRARRSLGQISDFTPQTLGERWSKCLSHGFNLAEDPTSDILLMGGHCALADSAHFPRPLFGGTFVIAEFLGLGRDTSNPRWR